jgi:hypothetical protein
MTHIAPASRVQVPDLASALAFLRVLDPDPEARFGFRTCADHGGDPRLSIKAYGTLDHGIRQSSDPAKNGRPCHPANLLHYMQGKGAGAFVAINRLDGQGQRAANIIGVRALFVDADTSAAVARLHAFIARTGLAPSVLVESGGIDGDAAKLHAYWRTQGCAAHEFRDAQLLLVSRLGTDPAVQDAGRVMRLPGFWHQKREPRQTRIVSLTEHTFEFRSFVARVKAEPQIVDPCVVGRGRGLPTGQRRASGTTMQGASPTVRLRALLDASGGLITPAVRNLLREAVAPSDGQPGNRHAVLVAVTARCMQAGWRGADVRELVLPVINGEWGDGDWGSHLDGIITWTGEREAAAVAAMPAAPAPLAAAFGAGGVR